MRLALLGDPVDHSLSPLIQNAALEAAGIGGSYVARRVGAAGLEEAFAELRAGELDGANVTRPHKQAAAELADDLSTDARRAAAANTLLPRGGSVYGANTDVAGIRQVWQAAGFPSVAGALVLGAGGAAAAALLALEGRQLALSARSPGAARRLLDVTGVAADLVDWSVDVPGSVVVNATPLGMRGEGLPVAVTSGVVDMAYGPRPTPAVVEARRSRLPVADGLDLLVAQGAASFELWTGIAPSLKAMRAAAGTGRNH